MESLNRKSLQETLYTLRYQLEQAFRPDTAVHGSVGTTPSAGHCAVVAVIVYELLGGEIVSTFVNGQSHWLNRINLDGQPIDVDLTGDQFGRSPLQIEEAGQLYSDTRIRNPAELTVKTLRRARLLADRTGLEKVTRSIELILRCRFLEQVTKIHTSGYKAVLAVTGGGTGAINQLLEHGGGSSFLLEAIVPYGQESLVAFLGHTPEKYVSDLTARQLAMAAYIKAGKLNGGKVIGFGATCSLAKANEREGRKHVVHLAYQTQDTTCTFKTELDNTRELEEAEVSRLVIDFLSDAVTETSNIKFSKKTLASKPMINVLHSPCTTYRPVPTDNKCCALTSSQLIFPGSFNPIHDGHKEMARVATKKFNRPVLFELSVTNADKPPLDYIEINQRIAQFAENLVVTNAPLFKDKAAVFPDSIFIVGIDTWKRIMDPKYYSDGEIGRNKMLDLFAYYGAKFMVFPRRINGVLCSLESTRLYANGLAFAPTNLEYPTDIGVSSTQLRKQRES